MKKAFESLKQIVDFLKFQTYLGSAMPSRDLPSEPLTEQQLDDWTQLLKQNKHKRKSGFRLR